MRRISLVLAAMLVVTLLLAACGGKKDAAAVVKDLDQVVGKMDSYQGTGRMTLHTGQQPQEYSVEVWYQQPSFYRIKLTNEKQDITQIVLRNNDGVFVLTPHLNKSFRFQSDWPNNQGQVYLYQSLAQSIIADKERQFTTDGAAYVFDVAANYQNNALARQKIWLDQKNLAPKQVKVADANANVMVEVEFSKFEFGAKFDKDSFDMQRNMTSMTLPDTMPTAKQDAQGAAKAGDSKAATGTDAGKAAGTADAGKAAGTDAGKAVGVDAGKSATGAVGATSGAANGSASGNANGAASGTAKGATGTQGVAAGSSAATGDKASDKASSTTGNTTSNTITQNTTGNTSATQDASKGTTAAKGTTASKGTTAANGASAAQGTAATGATASNGTAAASGNGKQSDASKELSFGIITPSYTPKGVKQQEIAQITLGSEKALLLRYSGTYNYNLIELKPEARETYLVPGDIVDLGYTIAVLSGDQKKTLIWTYEGVEYRLSTADLPNNEIINVAQSVQGQLGK